MTRFSPTPFPLAEAQEGLFYAQLLDPANPVFNTGQYLDLVGELDIAALSRAVAQAGVEAEALRLRVRSTGGQLVRDDLRIDLQVIDCTAADDPEQFALLLIRADMATTVDPAHDPLARQRLYRLAPQRHLWAQQVHHLAIDGYGMVLLTARVAELYGRYLAGQETGGRALAPLAGVLAEDAVYRTSPERVGDAAWWRDYLHGMADVTGMAPGRAVSSHSFIRTEAALPDDVRLALLDRAKSARLGWPDVLMALTAAYCRRFTGGEEAVVGVPHMGRMGSATARVPAMVMNVLPLRIASGELLPLDSYLAQVADNLAQVRRHGRYRSEQVRRDLGLIGGDRRLYGPLINVQPYDRPPRMAGLQVGLHVTGTGPVDDIHFTFRGDGRSTLSIEVDANPALYDAAAVQAHGLRLATFLQAALRAERLGDVPTATPEEARSELGRFNDTAHPVSAVTLVQLLEEAFRTHRDAVALRLAGMDLTYAELDRQTRALAAALQARGVGPEIIVAVALPRSLALVVALVAVLRAGGVYLPLDLEHPAERIATIVAGAQPAVVLAEDDPHGVYGAALLRPVDWPDAGEPQACAAVPGNAAYVIYTSGSTGAPKGVVVEHRAIVNRLLWMAEQYSIAGSDRILLKTPATFDVSVWEFFLPLIRGATLVVAPPEAHRDPVALARLIRAEGITIMHFVPSMLAAFLAAPESDGLAIARTFTSGEELPADLRDRFHRRIRGELHNLYGPTEAAVDVSYWPAGPDDESRPVPIGHPVWNTRLLVLDDSLRPVPQGMAGQLFIGGVQLARGYLGRPDLTAERFVADPSHPGERLYATGDLARRRNDGAIEFLGRADHQVKIRGLRIELGEIEAAIADTGLASAAVVLVRGERLAAWLVPAAGYGEAALRAALGRRLPAYMVPAAIVPLAAMPVTVNGKLDRRALPEPDFASEGGAAPATRTERRLAELFAAVLEHGGPLAAGDDFFALGGHSLSAVDLLLRIREEWGHDPGLATLFEVADIRGLAARIDGAAEADHGVGPLIVLARGAESPLFMVHPAGGLSWGYRTLATSLRPARAVYGLQAPALDAGVAAPESLERLAHDYAHRVDRAVPDGPVHLAGWSVGGVIAQGVAAALQDMGREVGLLALLDAYPADCWRAEPEPTEAQALRALLAIAGLDPEAHPELTTREQVTGFLRGSDSPLGSLPPAVLDGVVRVVLDNNRLVRGHHHRRFAGTLTHIRAGLDHAHKPQLVPSSWGAYAGAVECLTVPFLHPQLTGPEASALIAPLLSERMARFSPVSA
ncbi:enterobactin synthase [Croceibacterium mercuriale]|uniref:Enterobactin synthase n=1 Tax=Croceibacterium mercuriale TaxID=1572751 RepID=A0A0B2C179_9SPHN|nr:non-ribosomal peptide synthetase [Croceibacterium mercuriale]KHL25706.1 enterobactin synthase [Croceibacterium mercuriale]